MFGKYFCSKNIKSTCGQVIADCNFCLSLKKLPPSLEIYHPKTRPDHPGSHMNVNIMRRAGQFLMINTDLFSGYTTGSIIPSEKREDMAVGLLQVVTPVRHAANVLVRTDQASAFSSLA